MSEPRDDYLFDPTATPELEVADLERRLAPLRARALAPLDVDSLEREDDRDEVRAPRSPARWRRFAMRAAAAAMLLAASWVTWRVLDRGPSLGQGGATPSTAVPVDVAIARHEGGVRIESGERSTEAAAETLSVGDRIVCGDGASARVRVGDVGWLELSEQTRLRVAPGHGDRTREGAYQLELERGTVEALIFAAPRVFALGTPGGIAVDLGCIYRTTVDAQRHTFLAVVSGSVSFESDGRKVHVPAGAGCRAWPGFGPGTPSWEDSSDALKLALQHHDEARARHDGAAAERAIDEMLTAMGGCVDLRNSLSLWHLLDAPEAELRARLVKVLAGLVPPPSGVELARCAAGDASALAAWREELELHW